MATPREHIEEIRRKKFSIGGELNPLTEDLHQAVKNLSAELYAKDVHFLMELIQNAEDNEYLNGVNPALEFIITSRDITDTGALATLLIFNNEKGFSSRNIESICSVGRSTKKGNRKSGYIGEKGIGFKSVFLITTKPYIFSNGYQIRFNEEPCRHCNVGYIVPEWVEDNPTLSDIKKIYGTCATLPTTTIILPLKADKVKPVKQQLSSIHPEVLLFLSKIKRLSVREDNDDPRLNTVSTIAISSETEFVTRKNIDAESYMLRLSAEENANESESECSYYMWKQKFRVRPENKVERRMDVEEWVITLAFPNEERLHKGTSSPGIYAFLPTETVTNFPFIIQADFVLASSRESILWDDKWNEGILDCVPSAFVDAFVSLVITTDDAPVSSIPRMFKFLPVDRSSYPKLNTVRETIKAKLIEKNIVPSESYKEQKFFHKPCEVGRLMPDFWDILTKAREEGISLLNLSSHGRYILSSSFDNEEYNDTLNFLGVVPVSIEWYAKCIQSSSIVERVSENVYLELLLFIADNWRSNFYGTNIMNIPLIKYVGFDGTVSLCSINECTQRYGAKPVYLSRHQLSSHVSWLIDWNREFRCLTNRYFMPKGTQKAIRLFSKKQTVVEFLGSHVNVATLDVFDFAKILCKSLNDQKLVTIYAHFLYHSLSMGYLSQGEIGELCVMMPLVDNYGNVTRERNGVLVPSNGSKWAELIVSNPWRDEGYVELGEDYLLPCHFTGGCTANKQLIEFLKSHVSASDIPHINPPNAGFAAVSAPLTKENAFLLLDWIHDLKYRGLRIPEGFLRCIQEGSWLKITVNGCSGWRPPSQSFLFGSSLGNILQNGSVLVDIPLVDENFYGVKISEYKEELKTIGVMFEYGEACAFIGKHLMSLAASSNLTSRNVLSILNFIKFLRKKLLPLDKFIHGIKDRRWLWTSCGYKSPVGSVLFDSEWQTASQIADVPFISQDYYGEEILRFREELQLLGVKVGFSGSHQLVIDHLKSPSYLTSLTAEAVLLILECLCHLEFSDKLVNALKGTKCLKTNMGFKAPGECFLLDPQWGCILQVFHSFPLIDLKFYGGNIFNYKAQLKQMGAVISFEDAMEEFTRVFKQKASVNSITKENVASFLSCYRRLKGTPYKFPSDFNLCLRDTNWLRTRLGDYRSPRHCILFGPEWESISQITLLPFIDDSDNYYGKWIYEYMDELKHMGVTVELKCGVKFVAATLRFPLDPSCITPESVLSLLGCIRILLQESQHALPEDFMKRISRNWLKSHAGYRSPQKCLLFDCNVHLKQTDGPFIDEEFFGSNITSYREELKAIGVTVDVQNGCSLIASHLGLHSEYSTIVRIYNYLSKCGWKPDSEAGKRIWIPNGNENGEWVKPEACVLHDKDDLFSLKLNVLEKHYDKKLLPFFSYALDAKSNPSIDDYCELWREWETCVKKLSDAECCKFWGFIVQHWNLKTEKKLAQSLMKLPAGSGSEGVFLVDKHDVFIADDLQLKHLFQQFSHHHIFVWYPQLSLPSLSRSDLVEIYRKIGVRSISESVQKDELSVLDGVEFTQVDGRKVFIGKELVKLILGFLAGPTIKMEARKRHEAVQGLLNLTVYETVEPVSVSYQLSLSTGEIINKKANRMMRWERGSSEFFTQKMEWSSGHKNIIQYATYYSEAISVGVLCDEIDHVCALSELIKLAFVLKFDEEALAFLMATKNLQIFQEDKDFLNAAFLSE